MARNIDGRELADRLTAAAAAEVGVLRQDHGRPPGLALVVVGDDSRAQRWAWAEEQAAISVGMHVELHVMPHRSTLQAVQQMIGRLGAEPEIDGVCLQSPLPDDLDELEVLEAIAPDKDVMACAPVQAGRLVLGRPSFQPCLATAVLELVRLSDLRPSGREAVLVGPGGVAERQMALLLLEAGAAVTLVRPDARECPDAVRRADILIAMAGWPGLVGREQLKPGALVVDAGPGQGDEKPSGHVPPETRASLGALAASETGVLPLTAAMLVRNTVEAMRWRFSASAR